MAVSTPRRLPIARSLAVAGWLLILFAFATANMAFLGSSHAAAASLFELLFKPKKQERLRLERPKVVPVRPHVEKPAFSRIPSPEGAERRSPSAASSPKAGNGGSGGYQTMCVRLCDGYYWPIRFGVSSKAIRKDRVVCESSCQGGAELFYRSTSSFDVDNMRDLGGRPYKKLTNAYRYRDTYDPTCRCQADPWSKAAELRHATYAAVATPDKTSEELKARSWNVVLAVEPTASLIVQDGLRVVPATMPVEVASGLAVVASAQQEQSGLPAVLALDLSLPQPRLVKMRRKQAAEGLVESRPLVASQGNDKPAVSTLKSLAKKTAAQQAAASPKGAKDAVSWKKTVYRAGKL